METKEQVFCKKNNRESTLIESPVCWSGDTLTTCNSCRMTVWDRGFKELHPEPVNEREMDLDGTQCYYLNGKLHREDGPALAIPYVKKAWYLNGKLHRIDGPAEEWDWGTKYWYLNGELHREDGPAIEYADGKKRWFLNGKEYTKNKFNAKQNMSDPTNSKYNSLQLHCYEQNMIQESSMQSALDNIEQLELKLESAKSRIINLEDYIHRLEKAADDLSNCTDTSKYSIAILKFKIVKETKP